MAKPTPIQVLKESNAAIDVLIGKLSAMDAELIRISQSAAKIPKSLMGSVSATKQITKATVQKTQAEKEAEALSKQRVKVEKQLIQAQAKKLVATEAESKKLAALNLQIKRQNALNKENAILLSRETSFYQKLNIEMNRAAKIVQSLTAKKAAGEKLSKKEILQLSKSTKEFRRKEAAIKKADAAINRHQRNVGNYTSALSKARGVLTSFLSAFGVVGGLYMFVQEAKDAFNLTKKLDTLRFAMQAVIKDTVELADTQWFLRDISERFGAELVTTTERYIKFRAAAQNANFTALETQKIFGTMTKAAGVLGLKTDELQGVYLALEQMISKGKITTEELRRQLGERLPGAMDIMAKSMGVTTAELDEMLKKGEVITKEVLPAFARQVEISFGIESTEYVNTLQAATQRLSNAWTLFVKDFIESGTAVGKVTEAIDYVAVNLRTVIVNVYDLIRAWAIYKAALMAVNAISVVYNGILVATKLGLRAMRVGIRAAAIEMRIFNTITKANPLMLIVSAIAAVGSALYVFANRTKDATSEIKEMNESLRELDSQFNAVDKALSSFEQGSLRASAASAQQNVALNTFRKNIGQGAFKDLFPKLDVNTQVKEILRLSKLSQEEIIKKSKDFYADEGLMRNEDTRKKILKAQEWVRETASMYKQLEKIIIENLDFEQNKADKKEEIDKAARKRRLKAERKAAFDLKQLKLQGQIDALMITREDVRQDLDIRKTAANQIEDLQKEMAENKLAFAKTDADKTNSTILLAAEKLKQELIKIEQETRDAITQINDESAEKFSENMEKNQNEREMEIQRKLNTERIKLQEEGLLSQEQIEERLQRLKEDLYKKDVLAFGKAMIEKLKIAMAIADDPALKGAFEKKILEIQTAMAEAGSESESTAEDIEKNKELAIELFTELSNFGSAMYDRRIQEIEDEQNRSNDYYAEILDNEELTEQQRSAIEAERERKNREFEKRKREEERKKAIFEKSTQAALTVMYTASEIAKVSSNPFQVALVAALGAAQLATILATPIPQYEKGKGDYDNYEGMAIWGEKRQEAKISKDGSVEISPKKIANHMTYVKKDDVIHPDANKFLQSMTPNEYDENQYRFIQSSTMQNNLIGNYMMAKLDAQTNQMVSAIKNKKMSFKINQTLNVGEDLEFLNRQNDTL